LGDVTRSRAKILCAPAPLAAVAVLLLNDHVLKGSGVLPGWLTGKISDFAGLFFFPLLVVACSKGDLRKVALWASAVTALVFAALKLSPTLAALVPGKVVADPTDLVALPMVLVAYKYALRGMPATAEGRPGMVQYAGVLVAAFASMATSAVHRPEPPRIASAPLATAGGTCPEIVRATFDGGSRLAVELRGSSCFVAVRRAVLAYDAGEDIHAEAVARELPPAQAIPEDSDLTLALGFDLPYPFECGRAARVRIDYENGESGEAAVACE